MRGSASWTLLDSTSDEARDVIDDSLSIAVAGLGYWGPNLARNFAAIPGCELTWCCDASEEARARVAPQFPSARFTDDLDEVLADESVDAVALATPVAQHAEHAVRVLEAGKHCFVEKPLAQSVSDAERVVAAAAEYQRVLMVGHLLEYHPGVRRLKELLDSGELGERDLLHLRQPPEPGQATRGRERAVEPRRPRRVSRDVPGRGGAWEAVAHGESYVQEGVEDVVFCFLRFPSGLTGAPAFVAGSTRTRSAASPWSAHGGWPPSTTRRSRASSRSTTRALTRTPRATASTSPASGDIFSPQIPNLEPLRIECEHFVECVRSGTPPALRWREWPARGPSARGAPALARCLTARDPRHRPRTDRSRDGDLGRPLARDRASPSTGAALRRGDARDRDQPARRRGDAGASGP